MTNYLAQNNESILIEEPDSIAVQRGIEKFYNFYYPKTNEQDVNVDLEREQNAFVEYLVSTIDLENEIIVKTYGRNLQYVIEDFANNISQNNVDTSNSVLDNIVTIIDEYINDCKSLSSPKTTLFKRRSTINSVKKRYVEVANGLDDVTIELKREKRKVSDSISSLERYIVKMLDADNQLKLYVIAANKVVNNNKDKYLNLDRNLSYLKDRIEDLNAQKFLLLTQLTSLKITLESLYVVLKKFEYMLNNVIPKWRLHMALILQIQYVNDAIVVNNNEFDELSRCLIETKGISQKDIDNDDLITALINANNIINH